MLFCKIVTDVINNFIEKLEQIDLKNPTHSEWHRTIS